ncbi:hypothetical protein FACS1894120_4430 [Clostridia bacterium]|nr:hypothetical protein FACS1894120_4430 [Clostridia bacterium]
MAQNSQIIESYGDFDDGDSYGGSRGKTRTETHGNLPNHSNTSNTSNISNTPTSGDSTSPPDITQQIKSAAHRTDVTFSKRSKRDISVTTAYLIGVNDFYITRDYPAESELIKILKESRPANILRNLCRIRYTLMRNFINVENALRYDLKNIPQLDCFDQSEIEDLRKWGIDVVRYNYRASKYMFDFNQYIIDNVDSCRELYPDWVEWEFIRELFIMPRGGTDDGIKLQYRKHKDNYTKYPYNMYINWTPRDVKNLLRDDGWFLGIIYGQHRVDPPAVSKTTDASEGTKANIYDFINAGEATAIVVDCENSDAYKLYGVLKNLNRTEISTIKKISLYDDVHTTHAWKMLEDFVDIDVEYINVERISDNKSLVDIRMASGISADFYRNGIRSFILVSSDSDFWGVISSMPDAKFLVMIEREKCGQNIKNALSEKGIYYCAIDDFYSGNIENFKTKVLTDELEFCLADLIRDKNGAPVNGHELLAHVCNQCRVGVTEAEKNHFYDRYIKNICLRIDSDGVFRLELRKN